jgi:hypothetical protein
MATVGTRSPPRRGYVEARVWPPEQSCASIRQTPVARPCYGRGGEREEGDMTAIGAAIKPSRRPGELGVHSVDRFHFAVPDLAVAKNFYGEFGLEVDEDGDLLAMKTHGNPHAGSQSARARARSSGISRSARSTTISTASPSGSRSSASGASILRRASKRTAYGSMTTTGTWSRSRSRGSRRPTRSLSFRMAPLARARAAPRSGATSHG